MALEALSRGAAFCMFVDQNPEAIAIVKKNAEKTRLADKCRTIISDSCNYVRKCAGGDKYNIILVDPPYASGLIVPTLERIIASDILADGGLVFCETDKEDPFENREDIFEHFSIRKNGSYGKIKMFLLEKKG